MKRLISGAEAVRAGLVAHHEATETTLATRCATVPGVYCLGVDAWGLWRSPMRLPNWRSLPGYRKACRMLRRAGRQIRRDRMLRKLAPNLYTDAAMAKLLT